MGTARHKNSISSSPKGVCKGRRVTVLRANDRIRESVQGTGVFAYATVWGGPCVLTCRCAKRACKEIPQWLFGHNL